MTRTIAAALAVLAAQAAQAETKLAERATGAVYVLSEGAEGTAVLAGVDAIDTYTLHRATCYAEHPIYGMGAWQAVEGGWRIMVQGTQFVAFDGPPPLDNPACVPQ